MVRKFEFLRFINAEENKEGAVFQVFARMLIYFFVSILRLCHSGFFGPHYVCVLRAKTQHLLERFGRFSCCWAANCLSFSSFEKWRIKMPTFLKTSTSDKGLSYFEDLHSWEKTPCAVSTLQNSIPAAHSSEVQHSSNPSLDFPVSTQISQKHFLEIYFPYYSGFSHHVSCTSGNVEFIDTMIYHYCIYLWNMNIQIGLFHMLSYGISNSFQPYFGPPLTCQPKLPV